MFLRLMSQYIIIYYVVKKTNTNEMIVFRFRIRSEENRCAVLEVFATVEM